jgi:hypothetical protein
LKFLDRDTAMNIVFYISRGISTADGNYKKKSTQDLVAK